MPNVPTAFSPLTPLVQVLMKSALLLTANDQLDTIELHFQKLLDQMSLLARRFDRTPPLPMDLLDCSLH